MIYWRNHFLLFLGKEILISLVDHNEDTEFESMGQLVQVIDHHQFKKSALLVKDLEIDVTAGSCCTLVAQRYLKFCAADEDLIDVQIILLLYGPIVLGEKCFGNNNFRH